MKTSRLCRWLGLALLGVTGSPYVRGAVAPADSSPSFHFFLLDSSWAVALDLEGFAPPQVQYARDGRNARLKAENPRRRMIVTAQIQPATNRNSTAKERDGMIERLRGQGLELRDLKTSETANCAYLEYTLTEGPRGMRAPAGFCQRNAFVFLAHDRMWIDVHVSKSDYTSADEPLLQRFVEAVTLQAPYAPTSLDYFVCGLLFFERNAHRESLPWLSRAVDAEKRNSTLGRWQQRVLIDDLGIAYGMTGDMRKARTVLEYGITRHPDFPMYYYNLACVDAEEGKLEPALDNLRTAVNHRAGIFPGGRIPDPTKDDSFKRYWRDPRVIALAQELAAE